MADPSQDVTLVRQVLAGDKRSFTQLVDTHKNKIYGLLRGLGASPQDAQDYTQEAFLKSYRKLAGFREESSFASSLKVANLAAFLFYRCKFLSRVEDKNLYRLP